MIAVYIIRKCANVYIISDLEEKYTTYETGKIFKGVLEEVFLFRIRDYLMFKNLSLIMYIMSQEN